MSNSTHVLKSVIFSKAAESLVDRLYTDHITLSPDSSLSMDSATYQRHFVWIGNKPNLFHYTYQKESLVALLKEGILGYITNPGSDTTITVRVSKEYSDGAIVLQNGGEGGKFTYRPDMTYLLSAT